jgi:CRP-like cAMP-binding protein
MEQHLDIKTFERDEVVWNDGDVIDRMVFPHNMTLAFVCTLSDGTTVESATVGIEGYVGVESLIGSTTAVSTIIAGGGQASTIPLEQILILTGQMPTLRAAMLAYARSYMALLFRLAACSAVHSLKQRTCRRLLLALAQTGQPSLAMTQDDLARALGVGRTSVNQVCKELRAENLISYSRGHIQINNVEAMTSTACDCYLYLKDTLLI